MEKYIVIGSPGKYKIKAVRPGGTGYNSGMSLEAAEKTRIALNAKYFKEKEQQPPVEAVTPDESKLELNEEKVKEFYEVFTTNFYPPTAVGKALADPTKSLAENVKESFTPDSTQKDFTGDWILISKKLYEGPGIVSEIKNTGAISTTPNTLLWYNTSSKNTRPANEVPENAIINNEPIKEGALGEPGKVSNETFTIWTEANKETVINEELGVTRDSSLIELQAAAKKEGIEIPAFSDMLTRDDQRNVIFNLIKSKKDLEIKDAVELAKSRVSLGNVSVVTPEIENKTEEEANQYLTSTQVTVYKGTESKNVDFRTAQSYVNNGWSTEPPTESEQAQQVLQSYLVTIYKDGNEKQVDFRDVANWEKQGWSQTAPVADSGTGGTSGQYWFRDDSGSYGTSVLGGLPDNAKWVWDLPEFTGSQEDYTLNKFGDFTSLVQSVTPEFEPPKDTSGPTGGPIGNGQITNTVITDFNNIPENGLLWNVNGQNYIVYEVPGANGELYDGNPIYMAYEVQDNDLVSAGIFSPEASVPQPNATMDQAFFDSIAIVTGNTDQLSADIDNPFASFVETITEQSQVAPWITDPEMISLIAEAAVEGRTVSDAEWQTTNWYQTHNESEREWLRTYYEDPSTATQLTTDAQIAVANSLQAAGVSNAPEALINWVSGKYVSGEWSQTYTTEQISLFADPYATGKRDTSFENYLSSTALTGVDRTTEREREVRELYSKWLGPTLGKLTDQESAEIAGRLRDDPDYQDQLVQSLKQSRLAAFSNYTNPELTYEDIARPWRNLTTSVWGQTADETQGWWQEMVKSNDFATAQNTLREKGLEQDITQVTQDATQALQQALGQGTVSQTGVNV
jgi:hypothetical protein